jgi:NO-binding membrane sensor protein with MHYT domain
VFCGLFCRAKGRTFHMGLGIMAPHYTGLMSFQPPFILTEMS